MSKENDSGIFNDIISENPVEQTQETTETVENSETNTQEVAETVENEETKSETEPTEEVAEGADNSTKEETSEEVSETVVEELDPTLSELVKSIDPEAEYTDSKSALSAVKERMSEVTTELESIKKANKEVFDILNDIPEMGDFMNAVIKGMDPKVAAAIHISETLAPEEGEKGFEEYAAKSAEIKENAKKREAAIAEYQSNAKASVKTSESFIQKNNLKDDENFNKTFSEVDKMLVDISKGILPEAFLTMVLRNSKYEQDIKNAEEKGFLRGQNQKITLVKSKAKTDGMPGISSSQSKAKDEKAQPKKDVVDELLGM